MQYNTKNKNSMKWKIPLIWVNFLIDEKINAPGALHRTQGLKKRILCVFQLLYHQFFVFFTHFCLRTILNAKLLILLFPAFFQRSRSICVSVSFHFSFDMRSNLRSIGLKVTGAIDLVWEPKWNANWNETETQMERERWKNAGTIVCGVWFILWAINGDRKE